MRARHIASLMYALALAVPAIGRAQSEVSPAPLRPEAADTAPLPEIRLLLQEVERNQRHLEAEQQEYTYHVHTEQQELDKHGGVKKTETTEAESLTLQGIRINRVAARNGKALTPEEQAKENERIDKEVARATERRSKVESKGGDSDERGHPVVSLSRILELGSFSNERRVDLNGRPTIVLDYLGDPNAKTHTPFETAFRSLAGTVWIDEADRVLVRGEARFLSDFKLGGGLVADLHKGTSFAFRATRVKDAVWLPATIDGQGSVRVLLFTSFNGRLHLATSDYRRFRASATILPGHGVIGPDGQAVPDPSAPTGTQPAQPNRLSPPQP